MAEQAQTGRWGWGRWPWVTTVVSVALGISPVGQEFIAGAFSSEALARNIARPIVLSALAAAVVSFGLESLIWRAIGRRRAGRGSRAAGRPDAST